MLKLGGNVMIFPEAVWNMSPNQLVRKLYSSVYRIAKESNASVIPISTMMYGDKIYVSRGRALHFDSLEQQETLTILRDSMASLKWNIMETYGFSTRKELLGEKTPEEYWEEHLENYIARQEVYEREEESHAHYMDKDDIKELIADGCEQDFSVSTKEQKPTVRRHINEF